MWFPRIFGYAKIVDPSGKKFPIKKELTIGRSSDCSIIVPENYADVLPVHATISRRGKIYSLSAEADADVSYRSEGRPLAPRLRELMIKEGEEETVKEMEAPGWKLLDRNIRDFQTSKRSTLKMLSKNEEFRLGQEYKIRFEL